MAKNKVSEWSATPADNTDVGGIDINEGCAPSGINNAIRDVMAQIKDMQTGADGDDFVVGGNLTVSSTLTANSSVGTAGQALLSRGAGLSPEWGAAFVSGMIMMWSGSIASIPSGWGLCDGSSGRPDLRNRFVIGAFSDDSGTAKTTVTGTSTQTGGSKDAIVVSHTHTATVTDPGHAHTFSARGDDGTGSASSYGVIGYDNNVGGGSGNMDSASTGITVSNSTTGSSGTNANLPPYFALAYIIKL